MHRLPDYLGGSNVNASGKIWAAVFLCAVVMPMLALASVDFTSMPCTIVKQVKDTIDVVGPTLVLIMFTYGATKYAMSADNPGGRNQGKTICIHAIVAGLLFGLYKVVIPLVAKNITWWTLCPGVTIT
jgi:hypothetical protein